MRVGIEFRTAAPRVSGGIAVLLRHLLATLFRQYPQTSFTVFTTIFNRELLRQPPAHVEVQTLPLAGYESELGRAARARQIDVLFCGHPFERDLGFPLEKQIILITDLQHEAFPEFFPAEIRHARQRAFASALTHAGAVGTISEHARESLRRHPDCRCQDIFLMPPALVPAEDASQLTEAERALIPAGDFFLYPANLWPHKNHERTLAAFARFLVRSGRACELVLTGHSAGWPELRQRWPRLPVRHLGHVRPVLLQSLLRQARALLFFSLFEGFGMPLLEAFAAGTPVLCSNTTSLPEVAGDAALTADPLDPPAMAGLMERIVRDPVLARTLAERGRQRLARYSWEQSARELHNAFCRVAGRPLSHQPATPQEFPSLHFKHASVTSRQSLLRRLARRIPGARWLAGRWRSKPASAVCGYQPDNWLLAECVFRVPPSVGRTLYLEGMPALSGELLIESGSVQQRHELTEGEKVRLELEAVAGQELRLRFSRHLPGPVPRAFLLEATNLFSEADLAPASAQR